MLGVFFKYFFHEIRNDASTSQFALRALNNPRDPWERGVTLYGFFCILHESIRYDSKMADFEQDPAADFLAREQDDLAELGEDFGGEQPPVDVSY